MCEFPTKEDVGFFFLRLLKVIVQCSILFRRLHAFCTVLVSTGFRPKKVQKFAELGA